MSYRISIAVLLSWVSLLSLLSLVGCPGSLDNPEAFKDGGACSDVPALIATSCGVSGCHTAENPTSGLDLASADLLGRLSGKMAKGGSGLLIDTSAPEESVIYTKLGEAPPFGGTMPPSAPLDEASIQCVLSFLEGK